MVKDAASELIYRVKSALNKTTMDEELLHISKKSKIVEMPEGMTEDEARAAFLQDVVEGMFEVSPEFNSRFESYSEERQQAVIDSLRSRM